MKIIDNFHFFPFDVKKFPLRLFICEKQKEMLILRCDVLIFISIARFILRIFFDLNFRFSFPNPVKLQPRFTHISHVFRLSSTHRFLGSHSQRFLNFWICFLLLNFPIHMNTLKIHRISFGYKHKWHGSLNQFFAWQSVNRNEGCSWWKFVYNFITKPTEPIIRSGVCVTIITI